MARRKRGQPIHGWVILDKPLELNSTKAVSIIRRLFDAQKAGHAGTLDPLATGILPIALGEATKTVPFIMESKKTYRFKVKWGAETTTDDLEGEVTQKSEARPSSDQIEKALGEFMGTIQQTPPAFSAIKIDGNRAYDLARAGKDVALKARNVEIYAFNLLKCLNENEAEFEVRCGKGTYIRVLGRDLGRKLGCFGHISQLRRLSTGPFHEKMSISLEKLQDLGHSALAREALLKDFEEGIKSSTIEEQSQQSLREQQQVLHPIETALDDIPALAVNERQAAQLKLGQSILLTGKETQHRYGPAYTMLKTKLIAIGDVSKGTFKPNRVFNL